MYVGEQEAAAPALLLGQLAIGMIQVSFTCLLRSTACPLTNGRQGCNLRNQVVAQGYMAAMDLGLEARYKDVRTS